MRNEISVLLHNSKPNIISKNWIISQKDDLVWFIGSVVTSYALLALNIKFGVPLIVLLWIWALGFDGPHIYGTFSRTYADREERGKRAWLLYGTLSLFLLGPMMVLAGHANLFGTNVWGAAFFFFASSWAYYHLVKQHYGFMIIYKKKNDDLAKIDNLIDRVFLLLGMAYPFIHFLGHGVSAAGRIPFSLELGFFTWVESIVLFAFVLSLVLFAGRQVVLLYLGKTIDGPKILLLAAALPMHWIVLRLLEPVPEGALAAVATLTIYHNIQYNRLIWFHNNNKYVLATKSSNSPNFGLASVINKNIKRYIGFAFLFGAAYHIPNYTIVTPNGFAMSFMWGIAFTHYYLDSKIWRVHRDHQLNKNLQMNEGVSG